MQGFRILLVGFICSLGSLGNAPAQQGNPENPSWYGFKPWGEMNGLLTPDSCSGRDERFGYYSFVPIGKIGGEPSWIISRRRCDTTFFEWGLVDTPPVELLLYRGVKNGLPNVASGQRIGPDEINYTTSFIAAGDFDNDGYVDIATSVRLLNDTSFGNTQCFVVSEVVIWWGDSVGSYTTRDTTHLSCGHRKWVGVNREIGHGLVADISGDGIDDLVVFAGAGYDSGVVAINLPELSIFLGGNHSRWGRSPNSISRLASWSWWIIPDRTTEIQALDHDCDGHSDLVFIKNDLPGVASVLYGDPRGLPDTADLQTIHLDTINGRNMVFADITGDGVPELVVNCGGPELLRIYAGKAGQRLIDQYGRGLAPPDPSHGRPWSLPWAEVWLPKRINNGWNPAGFNGMHAIGDVNMDGIGDIEAFSDPFLCFYTGGRYLDSLIDAEIDTRGMGFVWNVVNVGDIDRSGVKSFAIVHGNKPGGILFYKPSALVPSLYNTERELPHLPGFRCEHATSAPIEIATSLDSTKSLQLSCTPNPTGNTIRLIWQNRNSQQTLLQFSTENGNEVQRITLPGSTHEYMWNTVEWSSGIYFITARCGSIFETTKVVVR